MKGALIDTHCHLDQLADPAAALDEAAAAGVGAVVAVSENAASMPKVLGLKGLGERVFVGLGMHPAWTVQAERRDVEAGLEWLEGHLPQADVLGEVGLDHKWAVDEAQKAWQEEVLERQLALATRCGKPANFHSRRCLRQVMERAAAYRRDTGLNVQLHWFTQSKKLIRICNAEGLYVSVGPTVIDDPQTQSVVAEIADELLLLETDAPVPIGGQAGHPARVRPVAEAVAALKGVSWQEVAALTRDNFWRFLGRSDSYANTVAGDGFS